MKSLTKILVCGTDSTFQYLAHQLEVAGYSAISVKANPLDIAFECFRSKPSAIFFSSGIEQPVKLVENLRMCSHSPLIFIIKSQKDIIPNKTLEEISDGFFYQPLDISYICKELSVKIDNKEEKAENSEIVNTRMHNHVSEILNKLCVTPNYNGYMYLREAIKMVVNEPVNSRGFSTKIYPHIAEDFHVSPASVERNIRTAINKSWDKATVNIKTEMFGLFAANTQWRPTNSEYILIIADMINREYITSSETVH
ncbi:MAG: sporulation initiation factor Spo0A C-terminal domain-containing protein [Oscillospiraceae bacterium]